MYTVLDGCMYVCDVSDGHVCYILDGYIMIHVLDTHKCINRVLNECANVIFLGFTPKLPPDGMSTKHSLTVT